MAMNGLERITGRILAEAQARADKILADAKAESEKIAADYAARAEQIRTTLSAEAEREGMERVSRAKSTAATNKRNLLLQTQSELIDGVFDGAINYVRNLDSEKYTDLLVGLLCAAFAEQMEAESLSRAVYGAEDAIEPEKYEVILNQRDRDRYGKAIIDGAKNRLRGKAPAEKLDKLQLADRAVTIDGGLILRFGDVESNCSLALLFAQLREELEAEVGRALFDVKAQNG